MSNYTVLLKRKVLKAISDFSMLQNCTDIIVGFSGGADSICLLHILNSLKDECELQIRAAHVNHGIRGEEADRDAEFARSFCSNNNIPFYLKAYSCPDISKETGESLEECGRRLRYEFFESICSPNSRIATAHNLNDNAETILFNIIRGTALKGASGIPPVRGNIIRPLIYCSREEIEGYCRENDISFVTDSTNLSDDYSRNKIRHQIIPAMKSINSATIDNIANFGIVANEADMFIEEEAKKVLALARIDDRTFDAEILRGASASISKQALFLVASSFTGKSISQKKLQTIYSVLNNGGRTQLFGDMYVESVKKRIRFFENKIVSDSGEYVVNSCPFELDFNGFMLGISEYTNSSKIFNKKLLDNLADCDKIIGRLYFRTRRPGDEFTFCSRKVTKSLKKLFCEMDVPVEFRDALPVLCDEKGIVWVYGVGVNSRCRIDSDSRNIIFIKGENND